MKAALVLMRPQHWPKNLLVFGGLFFSGEIGRSGTLGRVAIILVMFCLLSSATYAFNDWRDIDVDRLNPGKRQRPLAAGAISIGAALALMAALYAATTAIGLLAGLSAPIWWLLAAYAALNIGYSLGIKHIAVLELFIVAAGFVIRFFAGVVELGITASPWIVSAIGMGSLLIVSAKRRAEFADLQHRQSRPSLIGYNLAFLDSVVTSLCAGTLVVYLLFCVSDYADTRYGKGVMLTAIPVAMGLLRFLQIVLVEGGGEQPVDLLYRDRFLLTTLTCFGLFFAYFLYF
ncbi:UbiA prenyltransferase family protein [Bradyrhizobium sp.]|jgi:4-hydroxybenzoate polyprenyltransferase|uniref:UbiA prenyltransferase family protein n=1 Tax=Bradyrhizobium sp. TaxID=376 RepID=UPI003C29DA35